MTSLHRSHSPTSLMLCWAPSQATGQTTTGCPPTGGDISSPPSLASAIRVFWSLNKPLLVSVAMLGWRGAIYSGLCKQALASQQGSLKVPCFEELLVFRVEIAGASSAAQSMPTRKPSASHLRANRPVPPHRALLLHPMASKCNRGQSLYWEVGHKNL